MKLSEYIDKLQAIEAEHGGEMEVTDSNLASVDSPEWFPDENDGMGEVVVACFKA